MAAKKPHSVFILVDQPHDVRHHAGLPDTSLTAFRIPLEGTTADDAAHLVASQYTASDTTIYVLEDSKARAYSNTVELQELDDPRLEAE